MFEFLKKSENSKITESERTKQFRPSVSYSISYVRVCEWAQHPDEYSRPQIETLQGAIEHAQKIGDDFILQKIEEAKLEWENVEQTITPQPFAKAHRERNRNSQAIITPKVNDTPKTSAKMAVFSPDKSHRDPKIIQISQATQEREVLIDIARPERRPTLPYSLKQVNEEVITILSKDEYIEKALLKFLDGFEKINKNEKDKKNT